MVIMYSTSSCSICRIVKGFFTQNEIPFIEKKIDVDQEAQKEFLNFSSDVIVPSFYIKGKFFSGANPTTLLSIKEIVKN